MAQGMGMFGFIIYLVFGLYFLNMSLSFITMPAFLTDINSIISFVAGALLVVGGINFMRAGKKRY